MMRLASRISGRAGAGGRLRAGPGRAPSARRVGADAHQELAEVPALEEADQRRGRVLEPLDHVLAVPEAALPHPAPDVAAEVWLHRGVVPDDHALDPQPFGEDLAEHERQAVRAGG